MFNIKENKMEEKSLTVAEVIEKLQKFPGDTPVLLYAYDDYQDDPVAFLPIYNVEYSDEDKSIHII
jgi:hypothetical protein